MSDDKYNNEIDNNKNNEAWKWMKEKEATVGYKHQG